MLIITVFKQVKHTLSLLSNTLFWIRINLGSKLNFASTEGQNLFTFTEEEMNLEHTLKNEREVSGNQSTSTRNSIESQKSSDSLRKWTEVSLNLYSNSSQKSETESEGAVRKMNRKKIKTDSKDEVYKGEKNLGQDKDEMSVETGKIFLSYMKRF